jgi:DNA-binding NtrC family response regulator
VDAAPLVLVVEADPELRNVLIDALTWQGYEVVTPRHEGDLRKILRSRPVALVVSDPPSFERSAAGEVAVHALAGSDPQLPVVELADEMPDVVFFRPWSTEGRRRVLRRPFRLSDLLAACREALGTTDPAAPR